MTDRAELKLVLFDLGGVLLHLNDPLITFGLDCSEAEFHQTWLLSPAVREFERGAITAEQFASSVTREMQLPYDAKMFLERFVAWPGSPFPDAIDLVGRIPEHYACAILSNTNALHWQSLDIDSRFGNRFERYFLSYETGLLKPDDQAFANVAEQYDCAPEEILFFDDNPLNVSAANEMGMHAILCRTGADLADALVDRGIVEA